MPSDNEITDAILGAFDDEAEEEESEQSGEAEPVATEAETPEDQDEASPDDEPEVEVEAEAEDETDQEGEEEPEDEEESEEEGEPSGEEEETSAAAYESDDPEIQAFLARHQGDVEKALKTAANQQRLISRQGQELGQLREHVAQLDQQLQQASMFAETGVYLDAEQQAWVEQAQESGNQMGYIRAAVEAGEFGLARAVAEQWSIEDPFKAMRAAQVIDAAEASAPQPEPGYGNGQPLNYEALFAILVEHYPEMPQFSEEMTATLSALGEDHPLAIQARSNDPGQAASGIIGLYEIARAKSASVAQVREEAKGEKRRKADTARARAVVSSAQAGAPQRETPRHANLMPGLSLEDFEAELERQ